MSTLFSFLRPVLAGILAVLPVLATLFVVGAVAQAVADYLGPGSFVGRRLAFLGAQVVNDSLAYVIGLVIAIGLLYVIGLLVQTRLRIFWQRSLNRTIGRIPLVGTIYTTISRFVQLLEKRDDVDVQSMSPVWCYFSDERRTAVLGLLATNEIVAVEGEDYRVVMVPTAPVPFGGGLFFLPAEWVRAAPFGVEGLTNIYVSMGVTAPDYLAAGGRSKPARLVKRPSEPAPSEPASSGPAPSGPAEASEPAQRPAHDRDDSAS